MPDDQSSISFALISHGIYECPWKINYAEIKKSDCTSNATCEILNARSVRYSSRDIDWNLYIRWSAMQTNEIAAVKTILHDFTIDGLVKTRYRNEGWDSEESWCSCGNIGQTTVNDLVQVNCARDLALYLPIRKFHRTTTMCKLVFENSETTNLYRTRAYLTR